MCTYLKNMEGYKLKDLKLKEFDSIQEMFDKAYKRVNTFEDFRTELVEDEDEVAIDAIPLAVKYPSIVGWKIYKEGRKIYYQIMRADGKSQMYMFFSQMLKGFSREDLEHLYKLVKAKYESTRPVEDLDLLLWGDLKTMFEPHVEDKVWRNQQEYKVLNWKLYNSCRVKMFDIHFEAWTTNGISVFASILGEPMIMDDMTSHMCKFGKWRIGYARVFVEVDACKEFKDYVDV
ncbi:hypothetical protein Tco_0636188 [Tanacetum coccineum]